MTRDEIIRMAQEIGLDYKTSAEEFNSPYCDGIYFDDLECFAALVAAAEREECAKLCDKLVSATHPNEEHVGPGSCAAAIRARGEK